MSRTEMKYEWEKDSYAKQWIESLSKRSHRVYKSEFNGWMQFIEMSPKEQIDKRIQDLQSSNPKERNFFEDKVIEYKNRLETQGYFGKTILNKTTPIRSFFTANRVQLKFRRGELTGKKAMSKEILKFAPNNIEIRAMHNIASVRDRSLLTFLYHTGFSPVDVLKQNVGDIIDAFKNEDEHFFMQTHRSKTGVAHITCLSYEAIFDIKQNLKERGINVKEILEKKQKFLEENKDLNQKQFEEKMVTEIPTLKEPLFLTHKGERLDARFLNEAMKRLADKALAPDRSSQFKTKSLRDSYNVALLESEITGEIKDVLFGHMRLDARGKYAVTEEIIRQAYLKAFKKLSINGHRQTKKQIEELENKFDNSISTLSETVTRLKKELEQERNDRAKDTLKMMKTLDELIKKHFPEIESKFEEFDENENPIEEDRTKET